VRVLRIHAPGTPGDLAAGVGRAVVEFNRGLDIRLRFLSIGIEETVIEVADAAGSAESVALAIRTGLPDVVVLFGEGAPALAAATIAVRERAVLVRGGAGRRDGPHADADRAIDRLATVHLVHCAAEARNLESEGCAAQAIDVGAAGDPAAGERVVRALSRARRSARGGTTGGV
jgi:hypothetical protein